MDKILTISDYWDVPVLGLATFRQTPCIYERIFSQAQDEWTNLFYLTPVSDEQVHSMEAEWLRWCDFMEEDDSAQHAEMWTAQLDEADMARQSPNYHAFCASAGFVKERLANLHDRTMQVRVIWHIETPPNDDNDAVL